VASGQPPSEGWRPGAETCVFARTSSLFGVCGKHTLPRGPTFLLIVPAPTMTPYSYISPTGRQPLALFRTICRPDGILADVDQVKSSLSTPAQLASFWLLHPHIASLQTGFRLCQYRHAEELVSRPRSSLVYSLLLLSHARTVVRECCKGDDESLWERGKFDPSPPKKPLNR